MQLTDEIDPDPQKDKPLIIERREELGFTQVQMARRAQVDTRTLQRWEHDGYPGSMHGWKFLAVSKAYEWTPEELVIACYPEEAKLLGLIGEAQKLETLRKRANKTQKELADAIGITDHTYRNWLRGRSIPTLEIWQCKALCRVLNCSPDELPDDPTEVEEVVSSTTEPSSSYQANGGTA
jgi:DNA-binding XRE family transcriptional regulator